MDVPVVVPLKDLAHLRSVARGIPVRRETHHLALAAPCFEAEIVGDGRVEEADRMRQAHAVLALDAGPLPAPEPRRDVFPGSVDGEDRRLVERREEERAGGMR